MWVIKVNNNNMVNGNQMNSEYTAGNNQDGMKNRTIITNFDTINQSVNNTDNYDNDVVSENDDVTGKDYVLAVIGNIAGKLLYAVALFIILWIIFGGLSSDGGWYYKVLFSLIAIFLVLLVIAIKFSKNIYKVRKKHNIGTIRLIFAIATLLFLAIGAIFGKR